MDLVEEVAVDPEVRDAFSSWCGVFQGYLTFVSLQVIGEVEVVDIPRITAEDPTVPTVEEIAIGMNAILDTEASVRLLVAVAEVISHELTARINTSTTAIATAVRPVQLQILIFRRNLHFLLYLVWKLGLLLEQLILPQISLLVCYHFVSSMCHNYTILALTD